MLENKKLAFIGGGQMCEAIISGILAGKGLEPEQLKVTDIQADRLEYLRQKYGILTQPNDEEGEGSRQAAAWADIVVLAVKPQLARRVLQKMETSLEKGQLVISIIGGMPLAALEELCPKSPVLRVMPNTPMLVRKGVAGIAAGCRAAKRDCETGLALFELVGKAYLLPESLIDAQTSVSGCSPAFAYMFIEALADGAVEMGLPRTMALEMAAQSLAGAAEMVLQTGLHPGQLKDNVTSPGGGTIAGVHALEKGGFRGTVMDAVCESCERMRQVGKKA